MAVLTMCSRLQTVTWQLPTTARMILAELKMAWHCMPCTHQPPAWKSTTLLLMEKKLRLARSMSLPWLVRRTLTQEQLWPWHWTTAPMQSWNITTALRASGRKWRMPLKLVTWAAWSSVLLFPRMPTMQPWPWLLLWRMPKAMKLRMAATARPLR